MSRNNAKKIFVLILIIFTVLPMLCGCWNYVGLNEIGIVLGVAIDKENDNYKLTFEIVDLTKSGKETGVVPAYIESEGKTVFEAVRNAKQRLQTKLFFGHISILVISEQIAKYEGVLESFNLFLRDAESRETINLIVSQEKTAKDIITAKGLTNPLNSLEIKEIIKSDHVTTGKTSDVQLYQLYDVLFTHGRQLVLPAFHKVKNGDIETAESHGVALFKKDKLIGYLSPDDTFFYLFVIDELRGGLFSVPLDKNSSERTVFEINNAKSKMDFEYDKDKDQFKIILKINADVFLAEEANNMTEPYDRHMISKIRKSAEDYLKENIENVISKVQKKYNADIFGFGNKIYRKNPELWRKAEKDWDRYFKELKVDIKPSINIKNTASLRN